MQHQHHEHTNGASFSRRAFVKSGALALLASGFGLPDFIAKAAAADKRLPPYAKPKTLVCIFQRGAMDGLMAVTPFTDKYLRQARPNLFIDAANAGGDARLTDLDGRFGLHPAMQSLMPFFADKRLAIVHGVGSPNNTRSHFDAQDFMESGTPFSKSSASGWLNRVAELAGAGNTPFKAVSLTSSLPRSLYGPQPAVAIGNLEDFAIQLKNNPTAGIVAAQSFEQLYDEASNDLLHSTGKESFEAIKMLQSANLRSYKPDNGAVYPNGQLGKALRQIAQLIKMDMGVEVAFTECGGWDTHVNQGTGNGIFARNIGELANALTAFYTDLGAYQDAVTVMTMTEFGRTVKQNGTGGTDHGRGSCMFVLGNDIKGGKIYGNVPELSVENLEDGRDLPVTTDFRTVFGEVSSKHLALKDAAAVFPGFAVKNMGIIA